MFSHKGFVFKGKRPQKHPMSFISSRVPPGQKEKKVPFLGVAMNPLW